MGSNKSKNNTNGMYYVPQGYYTIYPTDKKMMSYMPPPPPHMNMNTNNLVNLPTNQYGPNMSHPFSSNNSRRESNASINSYHSRHSNQNDLQTNHNDHLNSRHYYDYSVVPQFNQNTYKSQQNLNENFYGSNHSLNSFHDYKMNAVKPIEIGTNQFEVIQKFNPGPFNREPDVTVGTVIYDSGFIQT
jgi:hypothetical protein